MRFSTLALLVATLGQAAADEDIILKPLQTNTSLPERLLIFLPGGLVPTENYRLTAEAIQNATTDVRLTVVIPWVLKRLCISMCPSKSLCKPLKSRINSAVSKSGFKSKNAKEDTFLAGHSLGTVCGNTLVQSYDYDFAGLMVFGGYVDKTGNGSIANYSIPVLHMAGEVDGGSARVSSMAGLYAQSKAYAERTSLEQALKLKPVHVLKGLDHSDFCPGFFVTAIKDCKSEVTQDVALATIGSAASAFLHLNNPVSDATKAKAMATMIQLLAFTQLMVDPFSTAWQLEKGILTSPPSGVPAGSWCSFGQHKIAGLKAADADKLKVEPCTLVTAGLNTFERLHTNYTVLPDGKLDVTCFTAIEAPGPLDDSLFSSKSVDCKMVDATRVGQQLKVDTNTNVTCSEINRQAVEVALKLVPAKSRNRFEEKGRGFCYLQDVHKSIGPLWLTSKVKLNETKDCLQVASSDLISTITSRIFPGNHYCKFYSVSAAMDWIMTDSHKPFPYPSVVEETIVEETIQI